jgi:hypothetical protein
MKLSRSQRAQVVELLRCAADVLLSSGYPFPKLEAAHRLNSNRAVCRVANDACAALAGPRTDVMLLEAAARVEEGTWP